jgi:hypothetical protein
MFLLAACLVLGVFSLQCHTYKCSSLTSGVCATFDSDNTTVLYSDNICPNNRFCSVNMLEAFALTNLNGTSLNGSDTSNTTFTTPMLNCSQAAAVAKDVHGKQDVTCAAYNKSAGFRVNSSPKQCSTSDDCSLTDNTKTECKCGFDGKSYCTPPLNSSTFDFVGENCAANNGTINDTSIETYASLLLDFYPYIQSIPSCMDSVLEVATIHNMSANVPGVNSSPVTEDDSSAAWVSLSVAALLQFVL